MNADRNEPRDEEGRHEAAVDEPPPFWEWVMATVGLLLLLASLGYLTYEALVREPTAPAPFVQALGAERQGDRWLVRFRVQNRGTLTAEHLKVTGTLRHAGTPAEETEIEFDFLPGESSREGGLFFSRDPAGGQLELAARGYRKP
jgi:uncharacterized protein (TIGR02588 family)